MSDESNDHTPCCTPTELCIRSLFRRAYGLFWDHAMLLIVSHLIILLIFFLGNYLLTISGNVLLGPFLLGAYKICLRIVRNENTELSELLSGFEYFLPAFVANILIHLMSFIAGWFLVIPGLIVFLLYSATYFFIFEENLGFWGAMESSRKMVWANFRRWLAVGATALAVNLVGFACCGVGLLISVPFGHLLVALAYEEEQLARKKEAPKTDGDAFLAMDGITDADQI